MTNYDDFLKAIVNDYMGYRSNTEYASGKLIVSFEGNATYNEYTNLSTYKIKNFSFGENITRPIDKINELLVDEIRLYPPYEVQITHDGRMENNGTDNELITISPSNPGRYIPSKYRLPSDTDTSLGTVAYVNMNSIASEGIRSLKDNVLTAFDFSITSPINKDGTYRYPTPEILVSTDSNNQVSSIKIKYKIWNVTSYEYLTNLDKYLDNIQLVSFRIDDNEKSFSFGFNKNSILYVAYYNTIIDNSNINLNYNNDEIYIYIKSNINIVNPIEFNTSTTYHSKFSISYRMLN